LSHRLNSAASGAPETELFCLTVGHLVQQRSQQKTSAITSSRRGKAKIGLTIVQGRITERFADQGVI
jgi:hypothetical protein